MFSVQLVTGAIVTVAVCYVGYFLTTKRSRKWLAPDVFTRTYFPARHYNNCLEWSYSLTDPDFEEHEVLVDRIAAGLALEITVYAMLYDAENTKMMIQSMFHEVGYKAAMHRCIESNYFKHRIHISECSLAGFTLDACVALVLKSWSPKEISCF